MLAIFVTSLLASFVTTYVIIMFEHHHHSYTHDRDLDSVHKFHTEAVSRIGGLAIIAGILVSQPPISLVFAVMPLFIAGLLEDLTNQVSPRIRLLFSFVSATIAVYMLDVSLLRLGWEWIDTTIIHLPIISIILTIVMIGGVSHAANIIDGFNGLLLGFAVMVFSLFSWVVWNLGDQFLLSLLMATIGALLGVMFFNFPKGRLFLGDGGAYLIGFLMAIFSLMLVQRHPQVTPWFPLLVLIYPVFETLFSIYRKIYLGSQSPFEPDGNHLHMLVYKWVIPKYFPNNKIDFLHNALTSVVMWIFTLPPLLIAMLFWDRQWVMISGVAVFCLYYVLFYFRISKVGSSSKLEG